MPRQTAYGVETLEGGNMNRKLIYIVLIVILAGYLLISYL